MVSFKGINVPHGHFNPFIHIVNSLDLIITRYFQYSFYFFNSVCFELCPKQSALLSIQKRRIDGLALNH